MRKILWIKSIEELSLMNKNLEESKKKLLEEIPILKQEILNKNIEITTLSENINGCHKEYEKINSDIKMLDGKKELLKQDILKKEEEIVFLHDKNSEITENINKSTENSFKLSLTNEKLSNDIDILKKEKSTLSDDIFYKKLELTNYCEELGKVNTLLNEEQKKVVESELKIEGIEKREKDIIENEKRLDEKNKRLNRKEQRLKDFKNELFLKRKLWQERETS